MIKGWKIGLSILGVCGLCVLSGVIGIFYWVKTNGRQFLEQQADNARAHIAEGQQYGATADQNGCVKQVIARMNGISSTDFSALLGNRFFLKGCLERSLQTPGFCDGVPLEKEIMASVRWRAKQCQERQSKHQQCGNVLTEVQSYCEKARLTAPSSTPNAAQP